VSITRRTCLICCKRKIIVTVVEHADAQESSFTITNDCPGQTIVLECTVSATSQHISGSTVWTGSFFGECVLLHSRFNIAFNCSNGFVIGQMLSVDPENIAYISRLIVKVNSDMIGQSIRCQYDNGSVTSNGSIELI
jgi:hypothetical protein